MMPHLYLIGLVVASTVLGICLASVAWSIHCRAHGLRQYELGREAGRLGERIATNSKKLRQLDAAYRRGWDERDQEYRRRAHIEDVARRVLAFPWSRN